MPVFIIPILITLWRWKGVAMTAKKIANVFAFNIAEGKMKGKYKLLLIEMFINIVVLLFIAVILPYFLEKNTIIILLASYYVASILWVLFHSIPNIICAIQNSFNPNDTLSCIIERESGFWTSMFFEGSIREAIVPIIGYMIIASVTYVVLFRFLAMPYFVQDATGMGIIDVVIASIYLPVKELIAYIF